jgi:hypothetical protein
MASEALQARIVNGEDIDLEQSTRLTNATSRLLNRLFRQQKHRKNQGAKPSLLVQLAQGAR